MKVEATVNMMKVNEFAQYVGAVLQIETPPVILDYENLLGDQNWAGIAAIKNKPVYILIQNTEELTNNLWAMCKFVAYEMRHCYQAVKDFQYYLSEYKDESIVGNEEYYEQPAELDAEAFAYLCMGYFFGVQLPRELFPGAVYNKVLSRATELEEELGERLKEYSRRYNRG